MEVEFNAALHPRLYTGCKLINKTDEEIAGYIGITVEKLKAWLTIFPEMAEAHVRFVAADGLVAAALLDTATGYVDGEGEIVPPNAATGKFWLKARQGPEWQEKKLEAPKRPDEMGEAQLTEVAGEVLRKIKEIRDNPQAVLEITEGNQGDF